MPNPSQAKEMPAAIASLKGITGQVIRIHEEAFSSGLSFMDVAARFADKPGTVLLMSGGELDCARYHFLAVHPWLKIQTWGQEALMEASGQIFRTVTDPFDLLRHVLRTYGQSITDPPEPIGAGLFGYLAYDLKDAIETLPRTTMDDLGLPHLCLYAPSAILVFDRQTEAARLFIPVREIQGQSRLDADRRAFFDVLSFHPAVDGPFACDAGGFSSPFSRSGYMDAISTIKEYIASGHIYQVNLSQRFETRFSGHPFSLFRALFTAAPAPFYAYIHAGDHHIVSSSPERFLMRRGARVETRPIKGTRPRGKTPQEDEAMRQALATSLKDDAELSMIVDLMRNDLGKVCKAGSVVVSEHKRLESYPNVFHLVSIVTGELESNADAVDLLRATFPGGSITGCPKIRAMEIIDELEPCRRHVYTGSIGYIGFHDTMDLSIAIRTITIVGNRMVFSVGGGVVFDSDPAAEYEETLHKGSSIMGIFNGRTSRATSSFRQTLWHNGALVRADKACIPMLSKGVQYGYGCFETIRADHGQIQFLEDHIERFYRAWDALFESRRPDLSWETIIHQVLAANGLKKDTASVKVMAIYGENETGLFMPELVVTASSYVHRLRQINKPGLDVAIYPHRRQSPLADHKTLNYLFYFLAGQWAKRHGADEALILNPDGSVSETSTANLLLIDCRRVIRPTSEHVLPGIMEKRVLRWLEKHDYAVDHRKLMPAALLEADAVILTNSLMGPVPVLSVDGKRLRDCGTWCSELRHDLLGSP